MKLAIKVGTVILVLDLLFLGLVFYFYFFGKSCVVKVSNIGFLDLS